MRSNRGSSGRTPVHAPSPEPQSRAQSTIIPTNYISSYHQPTVISDDSSPTIIVSSNAQLEMAFLKLYFDLRFVHSTLRSTHPGTSPLSSPVSARPCASFSLVHSSLLRSYWLINTQALKGWGIIDTEDTGWVSLYKR